MKNKQYWIGLTFILLFISMNAIPVLAQELEIDDDPEIFGVELEKLISFINGLLALTLALITFIAYRRNSSQRLIFVSIAFFLFSIRSFLVGIELFVQELPYVDPLTVILDFVVLLTFFYGILKK